MSSFFLEEIFWQFESNVEIHENMWHPLRTIPLEEIVRLTLSCKVVVDEATRPELWCVPQCWDS